MTAKKALCIGINYFGKPHQLHGCINDAHDYKDLFAQQFGYPENDIRLICDISGSAFPPTRKVILDSFKWLLEGLQPGDRVAMSYSGHGTHIADHSSDESDGRDEAICAIDGFISDDQLYEDLIKHVPEGVQLSCFFDCCHSGTILDLQYTFKASSPHNTYVLAVENTKETKGQVFMYSGCLDNQTSLDIRLPSKNRLNPLTGEWKWESGRACGAFTQSFLTTLREYGNKSVLQKDLILAINARLKHNKFEQVSQFSCSAVELFDRPFLV